MHGTIHKATITAYYATAPIMSMKVFIIIDPGADVINTFTLIIYAFAL
jgi:hypothetical protein